MGELVLEIMAKIPPTFAYTLGFFGLATITFGAFKALYQFFGQAFGQRHQIEIIRLEFGQHLALGLEFLLGKDLIASIIEPSWEGIGKLAIIIILRTILTYFLSKEIEHLEHDEKVLSIAMKRKNRK